MIEAQHKVFVQGRGSVASTIVIVGEAPGKQEIEQGKCFVGPTGSILMEMLDTAGIDKSKVYFTNAIKYMLGSAVNIHGRKYTPEQRCEFIGQKWDDCIELLSNEIYGLNPNIIVALGGTALQALCNKPFNTIRKWRGSVLLGMGRKVIPTFHPAGLFYGKEGEENKYWIKNIIEFDLERARKQSEFPEFRHPQRLLQICKSVRDLELFIRDNEKESELSVDIEAMKCIPICQGLSFDPSRALSVPLWGMTEYCKISDIDERELVAMWILLDKVLRDKKK